MEWWMGVVGALVAGLAVGLVRRLIRRGVVAAGTRALDASLPAIDRWEVRVDTRSRETFSRALVLDATPETAAPLVSGAMPERGAVATSSTSWRFRLGREFHVELVPSAAGTTVRASRYDVKNGVSPYYARDYAAILRRVRRAARRAGLGVTEGRVRHELVPADGDFSIAYAVDESEATP